MLFFKHRVNTITELENCPQLFGVEIDIRSDTCGNLYLQHDPMKEGQLLEPWLERYQHEGLILNVKEEGLELECVNLLNKYKIINYFFLDASIPFILKHANNPEVKSCIRLSEYEPDFHLPKYSKFAKWLWLDSFHHFFYSSDQLATYRDLGFKTCIVSPELQGRCISEVGQICEKLDVLQLASAVCTKRPDYWLSILNA